MCAWPQGGSQPISGSGQLLREEMISWAQMGTHEHPRHTRHPAGPRLVTDAAPDRMPTTCQEDKPNTWFSGKQVHCCRTSHSSSGKGAHKADACGEGDRETALSQTNPPGTWPVRRSSAELLPPLGEGAECHHQQTPLVQGAACARAKGAQHPTTHSFFLLWEGKVGLK